MTGFSPEKTVEPPCRDDAVRMAFRSIIRNLLAKPWDEVCRQVMFIAPPLMADREWDSHRNQGSYLIFILEGSQKVRYTDREGRKEYVHRPGEVLFLAHGCDYQVCHDTMFRRLGIGAYKHRYQLSYNFHMITEKPTVPDLWHYKLASDTSGYFKMFAALDDRARLGVSVEVVNRVLPRLMLLALLEMLEQPPPEAGGSRGEGQFRRICEYIDKNFALPISRKTLSEHLQLSESYISRLFQEHGGKSLSEYLKTVRMEQAGKMLSGGEMTAAETALACGFSDPSYFSRIFQDYWKIRPGKMRANLAKETS